ncbi:histidine phosphatase family protein [Rhodococcus triatomae]|uniref:Probable phosphoglycerate mutase n=1 Tax=Rhodococcus triatomae TaxID=300028 RepID=A0A1G8GS60_9NOCA|nr:histidine phosphatase family protein [Rhodococcus triatomae]QNG23774.1 histidine phosphatase family protein [Rhodococcus triatomae]SDH97258.1 probable phosphoglycerate mutase [Rhodococcus triatomae]
MSGRDGSTRIALVRHGETEWNRRRLLQGATDIPLNDTGRSQARQTGAVLAAESWTALVSSPLVRARETAEIIGAALGLAPCRTDPDLIERSYGAAEGLTREHAHREWPHGPAPGTEEISAAVLRGRRALRTLVEDLPGASIVAVTHGALVRGLLESLLGEPVPRIPNGAISVVRHTAGDWTVESVGTGPPTRPAVGSPCR